MPRSCPAPLAPNFRWTKPTVSLANGANSNDGHCNAYKNQGLGTLVGMPVPGTCTFAGWEMNEYAVVSKGKDQRLEAAIAALLRAVRR